MDEPSDDQRYQRNILKACNEILKELLSEKHVDYAWPFYQPFTEELLTVIQEKKCAIKTPMDLRIVKTKMDNHEYKAAHEFSADVRLIYKNCSNFYFLPSLVKMSKKLQKVFEKLYSNLINDSRKKLARQFADLLVQNNTSFACSVNIDEMERIIFYRMNALPKNELNREIEYDCSSDDDYSEEDNVSKEDIVLKDNILKEDSVLKESRKEDKISDKVSKANVYKQLIETQQVLASLIKTAFTD